MERAVIEMGAYAGRDMLGLVTASAIGELQLISLPLIEIRISTSRYDTSMKS